VDLPPAEKAMSETRRFPRQILVRLSDELATAIDAAAETGGVSSAAWLRELAAEAVAGAIPQDRQRSPRRGPRPNLSAAEEELRRLVRTLGVVGGATVQLTKTLREGGHPEHGEAERTLRAVKQAAFEAADLVWKIK
jgi:hypothetical protein